MAYRLQIPLLKGLYSKKKDWLPAYQTISRLLIYKSRRFYKEHKTILTISSPKVYIFILVFIQAIIALSKILCFIRIPFPVLKM